MLKSLCLKGDKVTTVVYFMTEITRNHFTFNFSRGSGAFLLANSEDIELLKIAGPLRKLHHSLPHMSHVMLS